MTPATLRKLEWVGDDDGYSVCPCCRALQYPPRGEGKHAPDCELDAAIREAEQAEKGERPEVKVGDAVVTATGNAEFVARQDHADYWNDTLVAFRGERLRAIYRDPLWRQEPPTP